MAGQCSTFSHRPPCGCDQPEASVANSNRGALLMAAELLFLKSVAILACNVSHRFQRNFKLLNYAKPFGY